MKMNHIMVMSNHGQCEFLRNEGDVTHGPRSKALQVSMQKQLYFDSLLTTPLFCLPSPAISSRSLPHPILTSSLKGNHNLSAYLLIPPLYAV
jgi:hypothetical protein